MNDTHHLKQQPWVPGTHVSAWLAKLALCFTVATVGYVPLPAAAAEAAAAQPQGEKVYAERCAQCHEGGVPKAPHKMFLQMMATDAIHRALTTGIMQQQATGLSEAARVAVAEYLGGQSLADSQAMPDTQRCTGPAAKFDMNSPPTKAGWGMDRQNRRFVPAAVAGLTAADLPKLKLKWAFGYAKAQRARSQPLVALGTVYVGSQDGTVHALDFDTGCTRWTFRASAEVRTAIQMDGWAAGTPAPARPLLYFGDLMARVYAVDALTGELVWKTKVDDHPNATVTAAPVLHDGRLYVPVSSLEISSAGDPKYACCTFRGSIHALDAKTGASVWQSYTIPEAPRQTGTTSVGTAIFGSSGAPIWNTPVLDIKRGVLYAGTGENYSSPADDRSDALLAFRLSDGKVMWARQKTSGDAWNVGCMLQNANCPKEDGPDVDFGAASILTTLPDGTDVLLAGQKSGDVYAVRPEDGSLRWHRKVGRGGIQGGVHFGMALDGNTLYVPISDMTGVEAEGSNKNKGEPRAGMHALNATTGELLWSTLADDRCQGLQYCEPGISAAVTAIPGGVIAGHMDGRLRAYDQATGKVLWETQTRQPFQTVNGVPAAGGSMGGGSGPVVQNGRLLVNSGYGVYFHLPGNVLLVYAPE
jgi:polyvinyl alcohol dehydrogenase (cytochrome)